MKTAKAQRIANQIVRGINEGTLPKSALQTTPASIRAAWSVSPATAQEIAWILTENWK
jgi:hypothetical protein